VEELETFEEAGACGTAAIITPIKKIVDRDSGKEYFYGEDAGEVSTKLYNRLRGIQEGTEEDIHEWTTVIL
jgi:branched-chain amino acid aminotransferase